MGASDRGPKLRDEGGGTKTKSKGKSSKSRKNATRGGGDSLTSTLLLVGAGVALVPLIRRVREWMECVATEEDGIPVEPAHFFPVIPTLLVNGAVGIGTGWSSEVLPHKLEDVISRVRAFLAEDQQQDRVGS